MIPFFLGWRRPALKNSIAHTDYTDAPAANPPAHPFMSRQMPPPQSPHESPQHPSSQSISRPPLPAMNTYPPPRESGTKSPNRRPTNMSISSIMGTESPTRAKTLPRSSYDRGPDANLYSPSSKNTSRATEPREYISSRPRTPDQNLHVTAQSSYRDWSRYPRPDQDRRHPQLAPLEQDYYDVVHNRRDGLAEPYAPPPRPFSQPTIMDMRHREDSRRNPQDYDSTPEQANMLPSMTLSDVHVVETSTPRDRSFSDLAGNRDYSETVSGPLMDQDRRIERSPRLYDVPDQREAVIARPIERPLSPLRGADVRQIHADRPIASREGGEPLSQSFEPPDLSSIGPRYGPPTPTSEQMRAASLPGPLAQPRSLSAAPTSDAKRIHSQPGHLSFHASLHPHASRLDSRLRRSLEESQLSHRSLLGAGQDLYRRHSDRASPLPQAVQGVSSQPAGPGRDPSIKSEFGKMFSGIGSGVGSTPQPMPPLSNGSPTPVRQQTTGNGDEMGSGRAGVDVSEYGRNQGGRKNKRMFEVDGRTNSNGGDERGSPGLSAELSNKRIRPSNVTHHHHHHHHTHGPQ